MSTPVQNIGATQFPQTQSSGTVMGQDDFLKLLITQLQNQDPMNPMDGTQFASQLAQFSTVEQLTDINSTLQSSIDANKLLSTSISNSLSTTVIGKEVCASGNTLTYSGSADAKLGYTLPSAANSVNVQILDQSGNVIQTLTGCGTALGDNTLSWNGLTASGAQAPAGQYTFQVNALDANGVSISASPFFYGTVTGVRFKTDGTVFVVDGIEVQLSNILEVTQD